jgi:hypothetical protein
MFRARDLPLAIVVVAGVELPGFARLAFHSALDSGPATC